MEASTSLEGCDAQEASSCGEVEREVLKKSRRLEVVASAENAYCCISSSNSVIVSTGGGGEISARQTV